MKTVKYWLHKFNFVWCIFYLKYCFYYSLNTFTTSKLNPKIQRLNHKNTFWGTVRFTNRFDGKKIISGLVHHHLVLVLSHTKIFWSIGPSLFWPETFVFFGSRFQPNYKLQCKINSQRLTRIHSAAAN